MAPSLKGRHLLTLRDYTSEEILYLLTYAQKLKEKKKQGVLGSTLKGKNIVLLFEKTSTRTRCAFEVAAFDEGANVTFLSNSQMGKKESLRDTANVLGRFYDGIEFRGYKQQTVEVLAQYAGVPVWNGLTDLYHPTQALADFLTMKEHINKPFHEMKLVYSGDGRNNVAHSLLIASAKLGTDFVALSPPELMPDPHLLEEMREIAAQTGSTITLTSDIKEAVHNADAIYTDIWVSMGEESQIGERIKLLAPYQVNMDMIRHAQNEQVIFLHCLPSFHDRNTEFGEKVYQQFGLVEMEVTDEVFYSRYSRVFDQAENRIHTIKAVMCATL